MLAEKILIAEDDEHSRRLMIAILRVRGYSVEVACDGIEALRLLPTFQPDIVLLDIQMPGLTGTEVCQQMKANPDTRNIPVMLVSALSDTAQRAAHAGADTYLLKPYFLDDLYERVDSLLALRPQPKGNDWKFRQGELAEAALRN